MRAGLDGAPLGPKRAQSRSWMVPLISIFSVMFLVFLLQGQGAGQVPLVRQITDSTLQQSLYNFNSTLRLLEKQLETVNQLIHKNEAAAREWRQGIEGEVRQLEDSMHSMRDDVQQVQERLESVRQKGKSPAALAEQGPPAGAMVIVEPRDDPRLQYVLENFDANMPLSYDLYIFHGKSRGGYARKSAAKVALHRHVVYVALDSDDLGYPVGYIDLLMSPDKFWGKIEAENILVFQTDAVLCSASPRKIADFERLGYIGCGIDTRGGRGSHWQDNAFWGTGGLSFRKKSVALECLASHMRTPDEDNFYSNCVDEGVGRRPESGQHLIEFCCQGQFWAQCFAAHKVTRRSWWNASQVDDFLTYCPEAKPLMEDVR